MTNHDRVVSATTLLRNDTPLVIATANEVWRVAIQTIQKALYFDWIATALRASQ
jgi:hypothetical protein